MTAIIIKDELLKKGFSAVLKQCILEITNFQKCVSVGWDLTEKVLTRKSFVEGFNLLNSFDLSSNDQIQKFVYFLIRENIIESSKENTRLRRSTILPKNNQKFVGVLSKFIEFNLKDFENRIKEKQNKENREKQYENTKV